MKILRINKDFLFLSLFLILINLPYFQSNLIFRHDTNARFQTFHFFYSEFFFHDLIPHWLPYGTFGIASTMYQISSLSPAYYFFGLIGKYLGVTDVLFLFKLSFVFDHFILLLGAYLLSRQLFTHKTTVFFVCLGIALAATNWIHQAYFGFYIFYLLPLIILFIVKFFKTKQLYFVWLAGIICVFKCIGDIPYFISLYLFMITVLCIVYWIETKISWHTFLHISANNIPPFSLFMIVSAIYLYLIGHAYDFTKSFIPGRDSETNMVTLEAFLTYGKYMKFFKFPDFISGAISNPGIRSIFYIGLAPICFFLVAILKSSKNSDFRALFAITIALIWLSFGGFFSALIYYFPAMSLYRHIGHIYDLILLLILLCSGFGLDNFLSTIKERGLLNMNFSFSKLIIVFVIILFTGDMAISHSIHNYIGIDALKQADIRVTGFWFRIFTYITGICLIFFIIRQQRISNEAGVKIVKAVIILCFIIDIISFQYALFNNEAKAPPSLTSSLDSFKANELVYQEQREMEPYTMRQKQLIGFPYEGAKYNRSMYNFVQFDPCIQKYRTNFFPAGLELLIRVRTANFQSKPSFSFLSQYDPSFIRSLGCNEPKLRLVGNAIFATSAEQAAALIKSTQDLDNVVILRENVKSAPSISNVNNLPKVTIPEIAKKQDIKGEISVAHFTSNELEVRADVQTNNETWLVYADAFHPGWQVILNGEKVPLMEANLAFKAVKLEKGDNTVRFVFSNYRSKLSLLIPILGIVFTIAIILALIVTLLEPKVSSQ